MTDTIESLRAKLAEAKKTIHDLTWNLAGCEVYALGHQVEAEPSPELAMPALLTVRKMALRLAEVERERDATRASEVSIRASAIRHDDANSETIRVLTKKYDAALAACAEMRAALEREHDDTHAMHSRSTCPTCALLARTDLGAGKVAVKRDVVERAAIAIRALLDHRAHRSSCALCDPARAAVADLTALLDGGKKGGG